MKETVNANIGSMAFTLDTDAYRVLGSYFDDIRRRLPHGGDKLRLPHPKLGERDFVLVPLEDLMHDPARFFRYEGVEVLEPEERMGHVVGELGSL